MKVQQATRRLRMWILHHALDENHNTSWYHRILGAGKNMS